MFSSKTKSFMVMLIVFALMFASLPGCDDTDKEKILKHANKAYVSIRLIVTDPAVKPLISDANMEKLKTAEADYLAAVGVLEKVSFESDEGVVSLDTIASCADIIIGLLDTIELPDEYADKLAAVRVIVKVLRVQLE